jgi:hypothetical protein
MTGGLEQAVSVAAVFRAKLHHDGSVGPWIADTAMPTPRSHHSTFTHAGYLYVVGGINGNPWDDNVPTLSDIQRARIKADGSLGAWEMVGTLAVPLATQSNVVRDGFLYVLGGVENNMDMVATIRRAPFVDHGHVGAWETVNAALPVARSHVHQTPVLGRHIYSAGGMSNDGTPLTNVFVGRFD